MSSEDSEDEPLSVLAASKRQESTYNSELEILPVFVSPITADPSIKLGAIKQECDVSITLQSTVIEIPIVERPADVWMYVNDFNPCGPYSCLLCSEWFINKTRIVIHYVVDHKKDYCGICRYFVANRPSWWEHLKFHSPWRCSQCDGIYETENDLREHLGSVHKLVDCRFCYLRMHDDEQYRTHLYQKHCVTNIANIGGDIFWDFEYLTQKFVCLLCSKKYNVGRQFADHYMSYHHLTLQCFMFLISGIDLPFGIKGVNLSPNFIETDLKAHNSLGYVDLVNNIKIKQEVCDEVSITVDCDVSLRQENPTENDNEEIAKFNEAMTDYKGEIDFDVTFMELIILQPSYFNYVQETLNKINSNIVPKSSQISYLNGNVSLNIDCCLCRDVCTTANSFEMHMCKAHSVKALPLYWCRVCAAVFDSFTELESHAIKELGEFEDLWICQFCDKEFDNREQTREHLTEHFNMMEYDNCFSPHLGFKCKYCPTLFWNETDREAHHVRVHFQMHKSDFYKCTECDEVFGDKVFFIHHYMDKHKGITTYLLKCSMCSVVMQNIAEMRNHFEENHPSSRRIYCTMEPCKFKLFSHRKALLLHFKAIHDPEKRVPVICTTCGREFNSNKALNLHILQAHGPARLKCTLCSRELQTSDERKIHYLISHPGRYQYQCDLCDKSFQYRSSLYMHKQEHSPNRKDYSCTYCGKVFMKKDSYREHLQIHEAPRHACSYCPMRFVQRSNMLRHERVHTGERPYTCKYCPRTFADKGACTSHSKTHLKRTKFSCVYCGQTFAQKPKLKYHIRKHTGENLETCTLCSKKFTSPGALREHLLVHQRKKMKKTVQCPLCNNMYPTERDMIRHMRGTHTNARFKCPLCRKVVCSAGSLREHVITHGKVKPYKCQVCPKSYHTRKSIFKHLQSRHGIKRQEIKPYYRHLDPKECDINLDDDVIDKIFGNLQNKRNVSSLLADFVYNKDDVANNSNYQPNTKDSDTEGHSGEEHVTHKTVVVKIEPKDDSDTDEELPPPDFVNVKIECVDENEMQ